MRKHEQAAAFGKHSCSRERQTMGLPGVDGEWLNRAPES
jgi:hypothetical protein